MLAYFCMCRQYSVGFQLHELETVPMPSSPRACRMRAPCALDLTYLDFSKAFDFVPYQKYDGTGKAEKRGREESG